MIGVEREDLGERRPGRARQGQPIQPRTRERPLMGQHDALVEPAQPDAADEALPGVLPTADREDLVVAVECGRPVAAEDAAVDPAAELAPRPGGFFFRPGLWPSHPDEVP